MPWKWTSALFEVCTWFVWNGFVPGLFEVDFYLVCQENQPFGIRWGDFEVDMGCNPRAHHKGQHHSWKEKYVYKRCVDNPLLTLHLLSPVNGVPCWKSSGIAPFTSVEPFRTRSEGFLGGLTGNLNEYIYVTVALGLWIGICISKV